MVHNPMSNLRIGSGVAPARRLLSAGVRLGIGTDASNTSDGQNMFEALRPAAYLSRVSSPDTSEWLSAEEVFRRRPRPAQASCGFERLGRLEPGYAADIVFLDLAHINYVPLRNPLLQVVFAENGAAVASVMVDGRFILRDGRMLTIDEARLRQQGRGSRRAARSGERTSAPPAEAMADLVGRFCLSKPACVQQRANAVIRFKSLGPEVQAGRFMEAELTFPPDLERHPALKPCGLALPWRVPRERERRDRDRFPVHGRRPAPYTRILVVSQREQSALRLRASLPDLPIDGSNDVRLRTPSCPPVVGQVGGAMLLRSRLGRPQTAPRGGAFLRQAANRFRSLTRGTRIPTSSRCQGSRAPS